MCNNWYQRETVFVFQCNCAPVTTMSSTNKPCTGCTMLNVVADSPLWHHEPLTLNSRHNKLIHWLPPTCPPPRPTPASVHLIHTPTFTHCMWLPCPCTPPVHPVSPTCPIPPEERAREQNMYSFNSGALEAVGMTYIQAGWCVTQ